MKNISKKARKSKIDIKNIHYQPPFSYPEPFFCSVGDDGGSGEIQIVEASDWLQEILLIVLIPDLSDVNSIRFTCCIVFVTIFFNMTSWCERRDLGRE